MHFSSRSYWLSAVINAILSLPTLFGCACLLSVYLNFYSKECKCTVLLILVFFVAEMQKYLDEAEEDKKRYIEELKIYQQSEQYQAFMKRQNAKKMKGIVGKARFEQYAVTCSLHTTSILGSFVLLPQRERYFVISHFWGDKSPSWTRVFVPSLLVG